MEFFSLIRAEQFKQSLGITARLIQSIVGDIQTASYRLVDTIKEEQAPTELTVVQLEAGSHDTQTIIAVNECLSRLKKASIH